MANRQKLHGCHACGAKQRNDVAGRFCSDECEKQHAADHDDVRKCLEAEGFIRNSEIPNLWSKGGVSVTEQECYERGIDSVLVRHQAVVANPAVPVNRKRR
jgi:hypothetical protein